VACRIIYVIYLFLLSIPSYFILMKAIEKPFFYGASPEIFRRAKLLRGEMTEAEKVLWQWLRKNQVNGLRFYRQHPISKFIVDFYCHSKLLVIELDGGVHNKFEVAERDENREIELEKLGLKVLRFKNEDVLNDIWKVISIIESAVGLLVDRSKIDEST
jgi:very-short-patch-repair endonuclease